MKPLKVLLLALLALAAFGSCSGEDDDDDDEFFNDAEVVDVTVEDSTIRVGEGTVVAVEFAFDAEEVFGDGDNITIVVRLPDGLELREGTSEIDGSSDDESVGAQIVRCSGSDETFLIFDLDEFDLDAASDPAGDGDAVLTLTVDGVDEVDFGTIEAVGSSREVFTCGGNFIADEQAAITVLEAL